MTAEFLDTNILIYAEDGGMGTKHQIAADLVARLAGEDTGALSIQVPAEYKGKSADGGHLSSGVAF